MKDEFGPTQAQWRQIVRGLMQVQDLDRYCVSFEEVDETSPIFVRYDGSGVDFAVRPHEEEDAAEVQG